MTQRSNSCLATLSSGRPAITAILPSLFVAFCLFLPATNISTFDGLPLASWHEAIALAIALPVLLAPRWRAAWLGVFGRYSWVLVTALIITVASAKTALWVDGAHDGFEACYRTTLATPAVGACERSFDNPFDRYGATRLDRTIDFGAREPARRALAGDSQIYGAVAGGIASSNWDLTFFNSIRFNFYETPRVTERVPIEAVWRGTIAIPTPSTIRIDYVGEGMLRVADEARALPSSHENTAHVLLPIAPGEHRFELRYRFDDGRREGGGVPPSGAYARLRVMVAPGAQDASTIEAAAAARASLSRFAPLRTAPATSLMRSVGWFVDLAVYALLLSMLAAYRSETAAVVPFGIGVALLLLVAWQSPGTFSQLPDGLFLAVSIALLVLMALRPAWRTRTTAFSAMLVVHGARVLHDYPAVQGMLYRRPGSDWLTYESFVRDMLETWSLAGGEPLFHYQVGFRYILFALRLLLGDGDVLLAIAAGAFLSWGVFFAFIQFSAGRCLQLIPTRADGLRTQRVWATLTMVVSGSLLLALMQGTFVTSLTRVGASEWPTWGLLPLAGAWLLRPRVATDLVRGSLCATGALFVRLTQSFGSFAAIAIGVSTLARSRGADSLKRTRAGVSAALMLALPATIPLLLLAHNVFYAGRWVVLPASASSPENVVLPLATLWSQPLSATLPIVGHQLLLIFYLSPDHVFDVMLRFVCWGLFGMWGLASIVALVRTRSITTLLIAAWPLGYLLPLVSWSVLNFYPRHLIVGVLAAGVAAMALSGHIVNGAQE